MRWVGPLKIGCFDGQSIGNVGAEGGTFTLSLAGQTTTAIAFNCTAVQMQSALAALSNVGAGNVTVTLTGPDFSNSDASVVFKSGIATELLTSDSSGLTGPDSPYTIAPTGSTSWAAELFTPAVGDIIEDFMHYIPVNFDADDDPYLIYTDTPDAPDDSASWSNPTDNQAVPSPGGINLNAVQTDFTNFTGSGSSSVVGQPTSLQVLIASWANSAAATGTDFYSNLPTMALNAVPVYALVNQIKQIPTQGEVWIWAKVSTPVAP